MAFEVRKAVPDDAETLSRILQSANDFKHTQGDKIWGKYSFTPEETAATIAGGNTHIAMIDGVPVGSVLLLTDDERIWGEEGKDGQALYVHRLTVDRVVGEPGVGKQIMGWADDQVREADRSYVRLDCSSSNEGLCGYYRSLGFSVVRSTLMDSGYDPNLFQKAVE